MRIAVGLVSVAFAGMLFGCSSTVTQTSREASARPRVEQMALSRAMDEAFATVDFSFVAGKRIFIETNGLSKVDMPFITSLLNSKIIQSGGFPTDKEETADMKALNIVKVSGTDEIKRRILSDKVRGQFKGTFTFVDVKSQTILKTYELNGETDETR